MDKDNNLEYLIYLMTKFTKESSKNYKEEIGEQGAAPAASGGGGTKPPYPTVTKWSSKRKFGPTYNPEQKVWASGTARGPGNTLI